MPYKALDELYALIDELSVDLEALDELILKISLEEMNIVLLVGLLTVTNSFRQELPNRTELVNRVRGRLEELAPKRVGHLLQGLE